MADPSVIRRQHWESVYTAKAPTEVSWYQDQPAVSLQLIDAAAATKDAAIIDVGGGASNLTETLIQASYSDLTVLDLSAAALDAARTRLGPQAPVTWLCEDLLTWQPARRYDFWHDRAVFHFLTEPADRHRYLDTLHAALAPTGTVILGTFASDGPESCSGLPVSRYDPADLADVLGYQFELVTTLRQEHVTPWGTTQPFTWISARPKGHRDHAVRQ
jgi:SAM-dependent methyltransferase